jgi:hypothetical protein
MATDLRTEVRVPAELLEAIRSLPAMREVVHCQTSFHVPVFAIYGACPDCGAQVKARAFSAELEVEDIFDTVFEWMLSPESRRVADERSAEIAEELHDE